MSKEIICFQRVHFRTKASEPVTKDEYSEATRGMSKYLEWLKNRNVKKQYGNSHIAQWVFTKKKYLDDIEFSCYSRMSLVAANELIKEKVKELEDLTANEIERHCDECWDILHDIKSSVEYLERKRDKTYTLFNGSKSFYPRSFKIYEFSKKLNSQTLKNDSAFIPESQLAAVFTLRQALELKLERMVGVIIFKEDGESPRLKHGFHYEFAKKNPQLFNFKSVNIQLLKKVYDWCSNSLHNGIQPRAWQLPMAYKICDGIFESGEEKDGSFSINGGIQIKDIDVMRQKFIHYFYESDKNRKNIWCIYFDEPEAADFSRTEIDQ